MLKGATRRAMRRAIVSPWAWRSAFCSAGVWALGALGVAVAGVAFDANAVHRFALDGGGLRETAALTGHTGVVYAVAFSPDGRRLASAGEDQVLRLWSTADNQPIGAPLTGHSALIYSVAFDPTGARLASGSFDGGDVLPSTDITVP